MANSRPLSIRKPSIFEDYLLNQRNRDMTINSLGRILGSFGKLHESLNLSVGESHFDRLIRSLIVAGLTIVSAASLHGHGQATLAGNRLAKPAVLAVPVCSNVLVDVHRGPLDCGLVTKVSTGCVGFAIVMIAVLDTFRMRGAPRSE